MMLTLLLLALPLAALDPQHQMPPGMTHEQHLKEMGKAAMGFDQDAAAHHFLITDEGGAVQVTSKDAADAATIAAIRSHLKDIERQFAAGDFEKPLQTHGEEPPGVPAMRRLKGDISYRYAELPAGGQVRIATTNADALAAIHDFLRYQITEHKTGDPIGK